MLLPQWPLGQSWPKKRKGKRRRNLLPRSGIHGLTRPNTFLCLFTVGRVPWMKSRFLPLLLFSFYFFVSGNRITSAALRSQPESSRTKNIKKRERSEPPVFYLFHFILDGHTLTLRKSYLYIWWPSDEWKRMKRQMAALFLLHCAVHTRHSYYLFLFFLWWRVCAHNVERKRKESAARCAYMLSRTGPHQSTLPLGITSWAQSADNMSLRSIPGKVKLRAASLRFAHSLSTSWRLAQPSPHNCYTCVGLGLERNKKNKGDLSFNQNDCFTVIWDWTGQRKQELRKD